MKKLIGLFLCAALLGSTFVGCASSGGTSSAASGGTAASSAAETKASDIKAVLILPGSINDQGWNASNCAGAKACNAKLGTKIEYVENVKEADFEATFTQYAERGYNLVMAAGNQFDKACEAVAPKFKDVTFTVVNGTDSKSSNMAPIFVKEYEGAYLAGIIAGNVTKNGKIATMGGQSSKAMGQLLDTYEAAAVQAAKANGLSSAKATRSYLDSWEDLSVGKQVTKQMINNGADTVFCYANEASLGSISAAGEAGAKFIGFAGNKNSVNKCVVASIDEDYSNLYIWALQEFMAGKLKGAQEAGIAQGIFKPVYSDSITKATKDAVAKAEEEIKSGKINLKQYFKE
jgi:basic membrane protein A